MSWNVHLLENVTEAKQLQQLIKMRPEEVSKMEEILKRYPMSIPQYYLSLIDFQDPEDPIRKMCIPSVQETDIGGTFDTSGESDNTVITGMQHKYSQTAMVLSTSQCAMYCRHCFRKRLVGLSDQEIAAYFEKILEYIKNHKLSILYTQLQLLSIYFLFPNSLLYSYSTNIPWSTRIWNI